ncbi:MAG: LLM class flavin-dependent oxidoreductase [Dehalococcoidia bacterium]
MRTDEPLHFAWYLPTEGDGHHLGTRIPERLPAFAYLTDVILTAERSGFDEILIPTGNANDSFAAEAPFAESWTTAALLGAVTSRIRLLVAVRGGCHNPGVFAKMAATLDEATGGRLVLNLVAGGSPDDMYSHALDHDERYRRLAEFARIVRRLWTEPSVDYDGEFFTMRGALAEPKPVQQPHPPFYMGGASPIARDLAVELVDTYLMWGEPPSQIAARIDAMESLAVPAGKNFRYGLRIHVIVRPTEAEARDAAYDLLSRADAYVTAQRRAEFGGFDSVGQSRMLAVEAGREDWVAPHLWAGIRRVRGGAGTALVGTPEQVAGLLAQYIAVGIRYFIFSGYPHREEAENVGRTLLPLLRERHDHSLVSTQR